MNGLYRNMIISGLLCCAVLLGAATAHGADELVTDPEMCVFLGFPSRLAYLQEKDLLLMINDGGVYAFDITSGEQRWHRYLVSHRYQQGATFGQRQVLGWSDDGVFLLDATTGRETWWRRDTQCGPVESAMLSPDETQVLATCARGCILYAVAGPTQRVLPKPANASLCNWLPGGKTLLFEQRQDDKTLQKYLLVDVDSGKVTPGWERTTSSNDAPPTFSPLGQFAEAVAEGKDTATLKISDTRTGKMLREFKDIPGRTDNFFWLRDATRFFSLTIDKRQARVVDTATGMVRFSLSREGHCFTTNTPFEDASGNAWIFSQDTENNWYVWPLTPEGAPRKVLDGNRIAPGHLRLRIADSCYVLTARMVEDQLRTHTAYTLEGMQKIAEWRIPDREYDNNATMINQAITHYVDYYQISGDSRDWPRNMAFKMYVQDSQRPLRSGTGRPVALSPNAKYLVVQTNDTTSGLYDTETDRMLHQFTAPAGEYGYAYMNGAFSDDGKRLVVNTSTSIEVMDLVEGYPGRSLAAGGEKQFIRGRPCLSPDGTRVLCGGDNCAGLFDAGTGALLHTLEETERFAETWGGGGGFWNSLAATARDWVGVVTDQFKPGTYVLVAFTDGGARVITHAVGQIIRVWDAGSGKLLHTIHTGLPEKRNADGYINNRIILSANRRFAFCYNENSFGFASLWSLTDGTLLRSYQLPESSWTQAAPADDGSAVYIQSNDNLYRWPGAPPPLN